MICSLSILRATFAHSQAIIHPLISYLIDLFQFFKDLNQFFLRFKINKFLLFVVGIFILFFQILDQLGFLLDFFFVFKNAKILLRGSYSSLFLLSLKKI